jgi:hypothetical protein
MFSEFSPLGESDTVETAFVAGYRWPGRGLGTIFLLGRGVLCALVGVGCLCFLVFFRGVLRSGADLHGNGGGAKLEGLPRMGPER